MKSEHPQKSAPELWGGLECTINRVQDTYNDQFDRNGHHCRLDDLDRFAALGIRALRYSVLWERTAPDAFDERFSAENARNHIDWTWAEQRLNRLRELNIRPIVGLVHHGSGPRHTSLVDVCFAEKLAQYAGRVAERFPWVDEWTPVNEPLTTARFSGLYGHWYPHGRDQATFARALINQCRATILSMQAIRRVNPAARLIQTEDLGKTYSTRGLRYQADFENERRWITWDLLCGRVKRGHCMWKHLLRAGIEAEELEWFEDNACPPDVIGINHYLTSERFLDANLAAYPPACHGGNRRQRYADAEAVRVLAEGMAGTRGLIQEAWERYGLPVAITEAHLGCTREEQMRWLLEVWNSAHDAHRCGVDVRAVTAWALLGSYDWDSLLTRFEGHYEPGVFDVRGLAPRPTALAHLMTQLGMGETPAHPALASPGWWRRPERLLYPPKTLASCRAAHLKKHVKQAKSETPQKLEIQAPVCIAEARPLLVVGAKRAMGQAFSHACRIRGLAHVAVDTPEMDIADPASVQAALNCYQPWAIVNAAGYEQVNAGQQDAEDCYRLNAGGPALLAALGARRNITLLTFSSYLVFNGRQNNPYLEQDSPSPMCVYGRSKAKAEASVREIMPSALIVRTGALFGPWDEADFVTRALRACKEGQPFAAVNDALISPAYIPYLVNASLDLLLDGARGIWHLAGDEAVTWEQLARKTAERAGVETSTLEGCPAHQLNGRVRHPLYGVLGTQRGQTMPSLDAAIDDYLCKRGVNRAEWRKAV